MNESGVAGAKKETKTKDDDDELKGSSLVQEIEVV